MVSYIHLYCHFIVLYDPFSFTDDTASIADIDDDKTVILEPVDAEHTGYQTSWGPVGYSVEISLKGSFSAKLTLPL